MSKNSRKNNGITLVALVVTIIILLILAGITIAQLTGNGLFEKAKLAKEKQENAEKKEEDLLISYENAINEMGIRNNNLDNLIDSEDLINWISKLENKITLEDITENKLLSKLMNSKKAVDYMITNENIMNAVVKSETAMRELGKSKYAGYKVIISENSRNKVLASEHVKAFDENSTSIPTLTSNNGNTISSSVWSSSWSEDKAFDKNISSAWASTSGANEYIGYDFNKTLIPYKVEIVNATESDFYRCKNFYIESSTDGIIYSKITDNLIALNNKTVQSFNIKEMLNARYVRAFILDNYGAGGVIELSELQVYCREIPNE